MQDKYAGDVGDFGKFGLLRHLLSDSELSLGINWYLFPNENQKGDGKFIKYLSSEDYKKCDPDLHDKLKALVANERKVTALESMSLFDCRATYFSESVDFHQQHPSPSKAEKEKRLNLRQDWCNSANTALADSDVVFLDPDNGLQVPSCHSLHLKNAGKYAYFEEIKKFNQGKKFTVIYHHLNRHKDHGTHLKQMEDRMLELKEKVQPSGDVFALRYHPYSARAFFILSSDEYNTYINQKLESFIAGGWCKYWDNVMHR